MQYLKIVFLLLALFITTPVKSNKQPSSTPESCDCIIYEYGLQRDILELAKELKERRFELPQAGINLTLKRNGEQQTNKRIQSNRFSAIQILSKNNKRENRDPDSCHKVIATTRHAHGYYIYALRHIII